MKRANKKRAKKRVQPLSKIRKAVQAAKEAGYRVVFGDWGVQWDKQLRRWVSPEGFCCPLGAVLLTQQPRVRSAADETAARTLGVSPSWLYGFMAAIDGDEKPLGATRKEDAEMEAGYHAGLKLEDYFDLEEP